MSAGYNFLQSLSHDPDGQKLIVAGGVLGAVLLVGSAAASRIRTVKARESYIVPHVANSTGILDMVLDIFIKYHDSVAGKQNRNYVSISATVFFCLLLMNLIGLVPGLVSPTTSVITNVSIALVVFIAFNFYGIREHGLLNYLKHFAGPVWWLAPLMLPLEIISTLLRVLTLNLRLYWNLTADHIVLGVFTDLTKFIVPVIFYGLGTFVCFMQAFVFTTLTMVYIFLAVDHGEAADHAGEHH